MNKPRVLHMRDSMIMGSPEKLIVGQINELNAIYDFYFCSYFRNSQAAKELASLGIRVLNVPFTRWWPIGAILALKKLIREYDIKLICCHDYKSNFLGVISGKITGIPVVSIFHGRTSHDFKIRCYEAIDNFILRGFEKVIAVSEASKSKLIDLGIVAEKIEVVCNAVELQKEDKCFSDKDLREELSISKRDFLIGYAGRLSREKGVDFLIEAMKILIKDDEYRNVKLVIAGDGKEFKRLKREVHKSGLDCFINFTGYLFDINYLHEGIDLLVLPSLTEGMPVVVLEAFCHKKPVIATKVGGVPEIIKDGETGLLVNKGDPLELAEKIRYCMENPEKLRELGMKGYDILRNEFNFRKQGRQLKRIYDGLVYQ